MQELRRHSPIGGGLLIFHLEFIDHLRVPRLASVPRPEYSDALNISGGPSVDERGAKRGSCRGSDALQHQTADVPRQGVLVWIVRKGDFDRNRSKGNPIRPKIIFLTDWDGRPRVDARLLKQGKIREAVYCTDDRGVRDRVCTAAL